ncbi:hypothetical protein B0H11DRAFT_2210374, partial [Mycena galericulata]
MSSNLDQTMGNNFLQCLGFEDIWGRIEKTATTPWPAGSFRTMGYFEFFRVRQFLVLQMSSNIFQVRRSPEDAASGHYGFHFGEEPPSPFMHPTDPIANAAAVFLKSPSQTTPKAPTAPPRVSGPPNGFDAETKKYRRTSSFFPVFFLRHFTCHQTGYHTQPGMKCQQWKEDKSPPLAGQADGYKYDAGYRMVHGSRDGDGGWAGSKTLRLPVMNYDPDLARTLMLPLAFPALDLNFHDSRVPGIRELQL